MRSILNTLLIAACTMAAFAAEANVVVVNPPKAPVLTQKAPAEPFTKTVQAVTSSNFVETTLFFVPAGKRLIVESVEVHLSGPTNTMTHFEIRTVNGIEVFRHYLPFLPLVPNSNTLVAAQKVSWYFDPSQPVILGINRSSAGGVFAYNVTLSGHLVDAQ